MLNTNGWKVIKYISMYIIFSLKNFKSTPRKVLLLPTTEHTAGAQEMCDVWMNKWALKSVSNKTECKTEWWRIQGLAKDYRKQVYQIFK